MERVARQPYRPALACSVPSVTSADWDAAASDFDDAPDHGLRDPATKEAWRDLLVGVMPPPPGRVADIGCGTGTLTDLFVQEGFGVDGVDFSPEMLRIARRKVPAARFALGDAANPPLPRASYDVVMCRHVLWALPHPGLAFERWLKLLKPGGVVVLVEGHWESGVGLTAGQARALADVDGRTSEIRPLSEQVLWGGPITDERYLLVSRPLI